MNSSTKFFSYLMPTLVACAHSAGVPPPPPVSMSAEEAQEARTKLISLEPASFKMLHQVVAKFQGQSYLMTGYLLGRKDGSFRVSAAAALGPKLFDVAKIRGRWQSHVYLKQVAEQVDSANLGRAVERIYFLPVNGPLRADSGRWVSTSTVAGEEDVDAVEDWRDDRTLALRHRVFLKDGKPVVLVEFDNLENVQGTWLARTVHLTDTRGFSLELRVTGYEPGFPAPDDVLKVQSS